MRKRGLREAKPLAPNHSTKTVHQKGTTRGDKIPHVQSKGSVYERPRATILHIHVVCSIGGNAIPFQKWGVLALRISIRSQVGGGFLDTEGPPSTPPSHSADGLASLSCPQRGREERATAGAWAAARVASAGPTDWGFLEAGPWATMGRLHRWPPWAPSRASVLKPGFPVAFS